MTVAESSPSVDVAARVRERTIAERKRRIWRSFLLFVLVTVAMGYVALKNRDSQAVRQNMEIARRAAGHLQTQWIPGAAPPALRPRELVEVCGPGLTTFAYNPLYGSTTARPTAVIWSHRPVRLFFHGSGRAFVLFDGKHFDIRWMTEADVARQRAQLGMPAADS